MLFLMLLGIGFGLSNLSLRFMPKSQEQKYHYSGTYSLFIEIEDGLKLNWLSDSFDSCHYELSTFDKTTLFKGSTPKGRAHKVQLNYKLIEPVRLTFGVYGAESTEIILKPIPEMSKGIYSNVDSLYVLGDVHGRYKQLIALLQTGGIINEQTSWIAGKAHLVFLGDIFDRGNDVTKALWFIYKLEQEAQKAGGNVHLVLGNHEIMTMSKDLRYVGPKEAAIASTFGIGYDQMYHPVKTLLGAWLRSKPSVLKIDKVLFSHGGVARLEPKSIEGFNEMAYTYMGDPIFLDIMNSAADSSQYDPIVWDDMQYFFYGIYSPYWFRGYALTDTLAPLLNTVLRDYKSNVHVVGHTPGETITERYKGKFITTDLKEGTSEILFMLKKKRKFIPYKIDKFGNTLPI